jgi:hypothetical protein
MRDEAFRFLRDSFYVSVGFGVLAVQKVQVRRRELEKVLDAQLAAPREQLGRVLGHSVLGDSVLGDSVLGDSGNGSHADS